MWGRPQTGHARSGEAPAYDGNGGSDASGAVGDVDVSEAVDVGGVQEGETRSGRLDGIGIGCSDEQGEYGERKTF